MRLAIFVQASQDVHQVKDSDDLFERIFKINSAPCRYKPVQNQSSLPVIREEDNEASVTPPSGQMSMQKRIQHLLQDRNNDYLKIKRKTNYNEEGSAE
jgi:hypothetical protein